MNDDYGVSGGVTLDSQQFEQSLKNMKKAHEEFERQFIDGQGDVDDSLGKSKKQTDNFANNFTKQFTIASLATTSITKGLALFQSGLRSVTQEYIKLDKNMAKVRTLTQNTEFSTAMYRDELFKVSEKTGYFASDLAEASYQALSAGVAIEDLGGFISEMGVLAKGGFTDITTAVDTATSIMNAYGKEVYSVQEISDKLIATQNIGKTTVNELGASAADFIPIAAQLGVELDEVLGMMASITKVGVPTSQAATQVSRVMIELADATSGAGKNFKELTGKSFPQFAKEGGTLTQALKILKVGAEESGEELITMFGRAEAGKAAVVLMKDNADDLATSITSIGTSAGAAEKANKIATTNVSDEWTKLKVSVINDIAEIGKSQEGFMYSFAKFLNENRDKQDKQLEQHNKNYSVFEKRRIQLQEKFQREGMLSVQAYLKARSQAIEEHSKLGTEGLATLTTKEEYVKPLTEEEETKLMQEKLKKDLEKQRREKEDQEKIDAALEAGRKKQAAIDAENAAKKKKEDEKKAREKELAEVKEFRDSQSIADQEFKAEQLQKEIDFFNETQALKDQNKLTEEEEKQLQTEFNMQQVEDLNNFRMESIEKEQNFYKDKENFAVEYNKSLRKEKDLELKILKDTEKKKKQMQKEEQEFKKEHGSFIKSSYKELVFTNQNMGKVLANIAKQRLQQYMIEQGEELAVDGTTHVVKGTAKFLSNSITAPPIAAEGLAEVKGGLGELAQAAVWGAAASAISVDTEVGGASDEYEADRKDREEEEVRDTVLEEEERQTVTYILPKDNIALYQAMIPGLDQAMKDNKNIIFVGEE